MPGGNKKVRHTQTNLQLSAAGLLKYMQPFCYHQALKELKHLEKGLFKILKKSKSIFAFEPNLFYEHYYKI